MRHRPTTRTIAGAALALLIAVASGCSRGEPAATAPPPPEYVATAPIKDLMLGLVDPAADVVWMSVTTVSTEKGVVETVPRTDDDWLKVRRAALVLAEATNLLVVPGRRVAAPGEKSETPGVELEPEEMDALIAKDLAGWRGRVKALRDVSAAIVTATDARDANKVFDLGAELETACENCHQQYWYPNEKAPYEQPAPPAPAKP